MRIDYLAMRGICFVEIIFGIPQSCHLTEYKCLQKSKNKYHRQINFPPRPPLVMVILPGKPHWAVVARQDYH
ncbi:hypothetical protein [Achromobacter xylosoxidans]|uniref:hypothetical protein n=1 Tax=Alcaligenes xylosoxydans xylosoxydans TaxID=85698 RepID=UPI00292FFC6D|nr:hypothetical protein [Achromobacter xylosoxidans]WOB76935.1 hypothetical protein PZA07_16120 [Achromobacter xylosoxidans]